MTKLSTLKGFGATSSSGGSSSSSSIITIDDNLLSDYKSHTLNDLSHYLTVTDLTNYAQPVRIRGFDTSTEAFFGINCMTRITSSSGNMRHSFILFSVNQTTGAITKKGIVNHVNNDSSTSDYSTFIGTSDEWTGRYTYLGHIPRTSNHQYGYNQVLIKWDGTTLSQDGNSVNNSTYYPPTNARETSAYVSPTERRKGGAVSHILPAYASADSKASGVNYTYGYSETLINSTSSHSEPTGLTRSTITSTNYTVRHYWQWDVNSQPYYDYFHNMPEGLYARNRSTGTWSLFQEGGFDLSCCVFHLSNGNLLVNYGSISYMVTSGGTKTTLSGSQYNITYSGRYATNGNCTNMFNIGENEWIVVGLAGSYFYKFKINPSTGEVTESNNKVNSTSILFKMIEGNLPQSRYGFQTPTGGGNYSSQMFTYGNENAAGAGYGKSKLVFIGGISSNAIYTASWDISPILNALTYS